MIGVALQPGQRIGSYELLEELGRGGLGVVYRARHTHLGRMVALKILHPAWTHSPEFVARFREEGRLMARLDHPNILQVYDAGEVDGLFYLATSHLEGRTLESLLGRPIPIDAAVTIIAQILRALGYAHTAGIIHRDVKPANVMVGERGKVTLMDLGVARLRDAPGMTNPGVRVGTPFYMAPEQILGKALDGRADLYATGVVLYQMVTGRAPFPGPTTEAVFAGHLYQEPELDAAAVPESLRPVLRQALAKAIEERFADAAAFLAALENRNREADSTFAAVLSVITPPSESGSAPAAEPEVSRPTAIRENRTALSLDVVGSSRMKQPGLTMAVQQQFALFRKYVRSLLSEHHCLEHVWAGDGLLALFTRPEQGAACVRAVMDGLGAFNARGTGKWEPIRVRIGLHHGPVRREPDEPLGEVVSRTLDTAGHLQKNCPENTALVSEAIYSGLECHDGWRPAGPQVTRDFLFPVYRYAPDCDSAGPPELGLRVTTGGESREFHIQEEALIGRADPTSSRGADIAIRNDDAVSRRHARIFRAGDSFAVEDLGSANGTLLDGQELLPGQPRPLRLGSIVSLGEETEIRVVTCPDA